MPGSVSFYLWEPLGIDFGQLIDRLIELALSAHGERAKYIYSYDSNILNLQGKGQK